MEKGIWMIVLLLIVILAIKTLKRKSNNEHYEILTNFLSQQDTPTLIHIFQKIIQNKENIKTQPAKSKNYTLCGEINNHFFNTYEEFHMILKNDAVISFVKSNELVPIDNHQEYIFIGSSEDIPLISPKGKDFVFFDDDDLSEGNRLLSEKNIYLFLLLEIILNEYSTINIEDFKVALERLKL